MLSLYGLIFWNHWFIISFFFQLKGFPRSQVQQEVTEMIKVLKLEDKTNTQSKALSGGMKRKLCVGIALVGGSKVAHV